MTTKDAALRLALEALEESRDDVATCLSDCRALAGIAFYEQQLIKHDAAIEGLKQALAQQEQLALTPINVDVTFSRGDIEELPEDQCPEWCAGSSDRDVKVHVHLGDAQPALSDERLAEIAKPFISSMGDHWCHEDGIRDNGTIEEFARAVIEAHCRGGADK